MSKLELSDLRSNYSLASLDENDVAKDPLQQFSFWFQQAVDAQVKEANAMILATCGTDHMPQARTVLLKGVDSGFLFFTNYESDKGSQLAVNPNCSLLFAWLDLERQVKINGVAEKISREESEVYFQSRPRMSQIGAWSSTQSQKLSSRNEMEDLFYSNIKKFGDDKIPIPPFWGGYRVVPHYIEFWQGRQSRLHDRIVYERNKSNWTICRLSP